MLRAPPLVADGARGRRWIVAGQESGKLTCGRSMLCCRFFARAGLAHKLNLFAQVAGRRSKAAPILRATLRRRTRSHRSRSVGPRTGPHDDRRRGRFLASRHARVDYRLSAETPDGHGGRRISFHAAELPDSLPAAVPRRRRPAVASQAKRHQPTCRSRSRQGERTRREPRPIDRTEADRGFDGRSTSPSSDSAFATSWAASAISLASPAWRL